MADPDKKLDENADGGFFVDSSCENFGICKELAPQNFKRLDHYHVLAKQPQGPEEERKTLQALLCCPKGAIGAEKTEAVTKAIKEVFADFPMLIEDSVYYCGFNSPKSAGASSYFIKHEAGNWLVSTPKYLPHLISSFESMGGVSYIFLSHRDDLGEADKYARRFGSKTVLHELEADCRPEAEIIVRGVQPVEFSNDFHIIPNAGHTEGHCLLLYKNYFLFSGDTLAYDPEKDKIETWNPYWTWYSYIKQAETLSVLQNFEYSWILASHGGRLKRNPALLKTQIKEAQAAALACRDPEPVDQTRLRNLKYYAKELRKYNQLAYAEKIEAKIRQLFPANEL